MSQRQRTAAPSINTSLFEDDTTISDGRGNVNEAGARRYIEALFASRDTLEWMQGEREHVFSGVNNTPGHTPGPRTPIIPAMLGSSNDETRDAGCTSVLRMIYNQNVNEVRTQLEEAGYSTDGPRRYVLLDPGTNSTGGGVSMQEGVMLVDETISPPRIHVIYRGTKDAEDFQAHVQGAGDYAFGQRIQTYINDYGLDVNADGSFRELGGEQLTDVTHPLIRTEIERVRAAHPSQADQIGVTFFGHSLGADPAARDAAYFNREYPGMEMDFVAVGAASTLTPQEREIFSRNIRGRETEIYNEDDPLSNVSNFFRTFNRMDSLGSGSAGGDGNVDTINVPAGHSYYDSMLMRGFQASIESYIDYDKDGWQARAMEVINGTIITEENTPERRAEFMHGLLHRELDKVRTAYDQQCSVTTTGIQFAALESGVVNQISASTQAISDSMLRALTDYHNPCWQQQPANDDREPAAPAVIVAMAREAAGGIVH